MIATLGESFQHPLTAAAAVTGFFTLVSVWLSHRGQTGQHQALERHLELLEADQIERHRDIANRLSLLEHGRTSRRSPRTTPPPVGGAVDNL